MTSALTKATLSFLQSQAHDAASTTVGIIVILVFMVLLAEKELLRAYGGLRSREGVAILNIAIAPLVLTVAVVVIRRMMGMLAGTG